MQILHKTKQFVIDFIEIVVISIFGLIGLIFIFTAPFEPPEERNKSLWQRLKDASRNIKEALLEVIYRK